MNIITESEIEQIAIDHLIGLGYKYISGQMMELSNRS